MGGYGARTAPADAVHDPLYAHALALGTPDAPLVLVVCDLVGVSEPLTRAVRERVSAAHPGATVWLGAVHTHSGPDVARQGIFATPAHDVDHAIEARIVAGSAAAAGEAITAMRPRRVGWASVAVRGVATNRDHPERRTAIPLDLVCLYGADTAANATGFEPATPLAVFGSFACHPTVMSAANLALSADLPGAFRRHLRERLGAQTWIALATGAAGDVSTRHVRQAQGFDELQRLGDLLADFAFDALAHARPVHVAAGTPRHSVVRLESKAAANPSTLVAQEEQLRETLARVPDTPDGKARQRTLETALQGIAVARRRVGTAEPALEVDVATAALGDLGVVALPVELYSRLGDGIRESTGQPVLLLGYTNGYSGYVPTREAYGELDYEVLRSVFAPGSGERLRDAAIALLADQRKGSGL